MAKRGLKIFGIGMGTLVVLAGVIVGVLFAAGILKRKPTAETYSNSSSADPPMKVTLSNPKVQYRNEGKGDIASGLTFNVNYDPWLTLTSTLHKKLKITFSSGQTKVISESSTNIMFMDTVLWKNDDSEIPTKLELTANVSYINDNGDPIVGPESDTLTVNIPTN